MKSMTPFHKGITTGLALCALTFIPAACASPVLSGFHVVNDNADGSVSNPSSLFLSDLASFDLTGGNNGSGLPGQTEFIGMAPASGTIHFMWSYTSCYPPNNGSAACDWPGYDWAGYMVGSTFTPLTDTDTGGLTALDSFTISAGSLFGWYVGTYDNLGEPGTITVTSVSFTAAPAGVPEPGTPWLCITCIIAFVAARRIMIGGQFRKP